MENEFELIDGKEDFRARFERWVQNAGRNHPELRITPNEEVAWTAPAKPREEWTVALATTAGVRRTSDPAFDNASHTGDLSIREIPADVDAGTLVSDEAHLDTEPAHRDINCLFPVERIRVFAERGAIGSVANHHVSMLGFVPDPAVGLDEAAEAFVESLKSAGADVVIFTPG